MLGAGVAGLAAAWHLLELRPNWQVTVIEEAEEPGGLASTWQLGQFSADLGPHRVYTELPEIKALLPDLIGQGQSLTVERHSEILINNHFYRYPIQATELLRHMGPARMAQFAAGMATGKLQGLSGKPPADYREAMTRAFGSGVYDMIIGPYTEKVWKAPPEELSEEIARVRVSAGNATRLMSQWFKRGNTEQPRPTSLKNFTYVKGGVQGIVASLRQRIEAAGGTLRTGQIVTALQGHNHHVTHVHTHACSPPLPVDAVISTVPLPDLAEMVTNGDLSRKNRPAAMQAAHTLEFIGMILVGVIVNRPHVTPNSWIYFPEKHLCFNRAYEPGNFDASMKTSDKSMLVFEITARWNDDLWKRSNEEIIADVVRDAISTGVFTAEEIHQTAARRLPHAYPLYTKDFREHLDTVCDYLRPVENLITTGRQGLFNHNNMDHSMLMGIRAAEVIAQNPVGAANWYDNLQQFSHFRIVD